jgi:hypothetical protein
LENHLNALETLLFVLELTPEDLVAELTIAASLGSEVVKHTVRGDVVTVHFTNIHQALFNGEQLRLVKLNHI